MARYHDGQARYARPKRDGDLYGGRRNRFDTHMENWLYEEGDARDYLNYVEYGESPRDDFRVEQSRASESMEVPSRRPKVRAGMKIHHKKYGKGKVVSIKNDKLECRFDSCGDKTFVYPYVIDQGIVEIG